MPIFDMFKQSQKVEGSIGFFGLADWWLNSFTESEREYIEQKFKPMTTGAPNNRPLTQGKILSTSQTASGLLCGLASWFKKPEEFSIGRRIAEKSIELSGSNILDRHFAYQQMIEICYNSRGNEASAMDLAIQTCELQIALAPQAAEAFRKKYIGQPLPRPVGYEQLAIIREKEKNYFEAIILSKQAKEQGWTGEWDKRIERCEKKFRKLQSP